MTALTVRRWWASKSAGVITEVTSPTVLAPVLLIAVAVDQWRERGPVSIGWGMVAATFAGVLPLLFLRVGVRRGRWADHHVDERAARRMPLAFALASVLVGLVILAVAGAPRDLLALIVAMDAGLAAVLVVSHWWKISIHSAVAGGTAVILALQFGAAGLWVGVVLAAVAAWSRAALAKHTTGQILSGLLLGAVIAGSLYPGLR